MDLPTPTVAMASPTGPFYMERGATGQPYPDPFGTAPTPPGLSLHGQSTHRGIQTTILGVLFLLPMNIFYIVFVLALLYPFIRMYISHRRAVEVRSCRHIYPFHFENSSQLCMLQDATNESIYNVYVPGSSQVVYRFVRMRSPFLQGLLHEQWKFADSTGFELAQIYKRRTLGRHGYVHFLLSRSAEERQSGTVRITPRTSETPTQKHHTRQQPHGIGQSFTILSSDTTSRSLESVSFPGGPLVSAVIQEVFTRQEPFVPAVSQVLLNDSSLVGNALISSDQLGSKVPFAPYQVLRAENVEVRNLHNVCVKTTRYFATTTFRLVRDEHTFMTWDPVGNLERYYCNDRLSVSVCERVGLMSKHVSDGSVGYNIFFDAQRIDEVSVLTTSFLQFKNQLR